MSAVNAMKSGNTLKTEKTAGKMFLYTAPAFVWAAVMLTVSSLPGSSLPSVSLWQWDKLAHAFEYLVFSILLVRWFVLGRGLHAPNALWMGAGIGAAFGLVDELHQIPIPFRQCTWQDLVANWAGVGMGFLIARGLLRKGLLR